MSGSRIGTDWAERASRAERERDEYQAQVHDLAERVRNMTSAATSAAGSTVIALERLQEYQEVVDAAVDWVEGRGNNPAGCLAAKVREHIARVKARS